MVPDDASIERRLAWLKEISDQGAADPEIQAAAARIRAEADRLAGSAPSKRGHWYARLLALETLRLVHQVPYVPDPPGKDRFAPASWTLKYGGDCDDLAALFSALCCVLGLKVRVDWITQRGASLDHVTAMVWLDGVWWWAEPSVPGAMLGESPYSAIARQGAWHVVGGKQGPEPDGVDPRVFQWDGWKVYWSGWPVPWFQRNFPYLFHPMRKS